VEGELRLGRCRKPGWGTTWENGEKLVSKWSRTVGWHGMACTGAGGGPGKNVREVCYFSDMILRGGRKRLLEGVKWGEKGVLEG